MQQIQIQYVPLTELKPYEQNPRFWSAEATEQLKESIKKFGYLDPLIMNTAKGREGVVLSGNFRLKIAQEMKIEKIPVVKVHIEDKEKERELVLRMNKNVGAWDMEILKEFDIELLMDVGFNDQDLTDVWDAQLETEDDNFVTEQEIEKAKNTAIQSGDIFQLGNSKLICGDSTDVTIVQKLVGNERIDMIYCDPPYNIQLNYNKGIGGKAEYGGSERDTRTDSEYREFLKKTIANTLSVTKQDAHIFYYCDQRYIGMMQSLYEELEVKNERVCMWIKNGANLTPKNAFNKSYEPCVYGTLGKPYLNTNIKNLNEILNKEIGTGNRTADDILDLLDIWLVKRLPGSEYEHPTQKPITLHEKPLKRCSRPGQNILDLFGGSGSTLLACEQMKRRAFLVEQDPVFTQLIINRYEQTTNSKARKLN